MHNTAQHNTVGRTLSTTSEGLLGDKNDKTEHQTEKIYCDTLLLTENELSVKDFKTMPYTLITNTEMHTCTIKNIMIVLLQVTLLIKLESMPIPSIEIKLF